MATVHEALKARLDGYAGLLALVSTRNYPGRLPSGVTYPANRYSQIGEERFHAMGSDGTPKGTRFQVSSFAESYMGALAVAGQVVAAVSRWRGTQSGVVVEDVLFEGQIGPMWDEGVGEVGGYHVATDIVVYHEG